MIAALALLALASPAEPAEAQGCKKCSDHGFVACRRHSKAELALEENARACSRLARCAECGGALRIACDNCDAQAKEEAKVAAERAAVEKWLKGRSEVDAYIGRPLLHLESDHFRLVWEIPEMIVGRRRLDAHEAAHLYLGRMEDLHALFRKTFVAKPEEIPSKVDLYAWNDIEEHMMAGRKYASGGARGGVKLLGIQPVFSFYRDRNQLPDDEAVHRHLVHAVAHLLLSNAWNSIWVGGIKGGWADEGTAHYFEDLLFGVCTNFCYEEVNTNVTFRGGKWRVPVREMVLKQRFTPFAELSRKLSTDLTTPEHAQSWSHCEYLIALDGAKFAALVRVLQQKRLAAEALREAYGMSVVEFEEAWKKHVVDTYPPR